MSVSPIFVELRASIGEFQTKMGEAREELTKLDKKGAGTSQKLAAVGKGATLGLAGVAVAVGGFSLEMADKFEGAHAALESAVKNSGTTIESLKGPLSRTEKQLEKYGFTNTQVEDAVARMTNATNDPKKAIGEMALAANIAAARHISLSDATDMLSKALAGGVKPLKQMGINLPVTASGAMSVTKAQRALRDAQERLTETMTKYPKTANESIVAQQAQQNAIYAVRNAHENLADAQKSQGLIMSTLTKRFGGSAATAADTFAGKVKAMKTQAQDMGKNLGMKLIPMIEKLMTATMKVVTWLSKHKTAATALAVVVGGALLVAIGAYIVSMVSAAVATVAAALPIILIIAAIGLLVFAVFQLVKHWHAIWENIKLAAGVAWHWLEDNVIHPVADAFVKYIVNPVKKAMRDVEDAWNAMRDAVSRVWSDIKQWITDGINDIKSIEGKIRAALSRVEEVFTAPFRAAWDFIKSIPDKIGGVIGGIADKLKKIPGASLLKHIPGFAVGTSYSPGGLALVGERGPEIVDLPAGSKVSTARESSRRINAMQAAPQSSTTNNYTVTVNIPHGVSPLSAATAFSEMIDRRERALRR